jgi:hypothetical protein
MSVINRAIAYLFLHCILMAPAMSQIGGGTPLPGTPIDRVELPGAPGVYVSGYSWGTPYFLMIDGMPFRLVEYTGGILNEKASGHGKLTTGEPPPKLLPGSFGGYGNPFGVPGFVYEGTFVEGRPVGAGSLTNRMTNQKIQAQFSGFLKFSGQGVLSMDDKPLAIATFSQSEPVDGPYRRYLYTPMGNGPTREYVGTLAGGILMGEWKSRDWVEQAGNNIYSFKNGNLVIQRAGSTTITCTPLITDPLPTPLYTPPNDVIGALTSRTDPTVTPRDMRCEEPVGALGKIVYQMTRTATGTTVTPISCSNANGKTGKLTLGKDVLTCTTFGTRNGRLSDPLGDMWRDLKKMF